MKKRIAIIVALVALIGITLYFYNDANMKKAYENMIDSQEQLNDLVLQGAKILQEQYLNSINQIMDAMDKGIWGSGGFNKVKEN